MVRRAVADGSMSRVQLAALFGVSKITIDRLVRRETYAWVPDAPPPVESADMSPDAIAQRLLNIGGKKHGK